MKKLTVITLLFLAMLSSGYRKPDVYVIDAVKNANDHNNKGVMYMKDMCYYAAIQEFKIAISINGNAQASAVYYNNLGKAYMTIGYPDLAQDCFERAINQYSLNLEYYQNLANCYKARGILDLKIKQAKSSSNPLNMVRLGILYSEKGDIQHAITLLDEFTVKEPALLITPSVRKYIQNLVKQVQ